MSRNSRRLQLIRNIYGKARCVHSDVLIRSIIRPFSKGTRSRTIGGRCSICHRDVRREMTTPDIDSQWTLDQ